MAASSHNRPLTRDAVFEAHGRIKQYIHRTPVLTSTTLSDLASTPQDVSKLKGTEFEGQRPARPRMRFFFKCENYQKVGAFKARGAFHALSRLSEEELARGVVTHSSGMVMLYLTFPSSLSYLRHTRLAQVRRSTSSSLSQERM